MRSIDDRALVGLLSTTLLPNPPQPNLQGRSWSCALFCSRGALQVRKCRWRGICDLFACYSDKHIPMAGTVKRAEIECLPGTERQAIIIRSV